MVLGEIMKIKLDAIESGINKVDDNPPTVSGEVLTYRGESYDLSQLPNGAEVEADAPFTDKIKRSVDGELSVSVSKSPEVRGFFVSVCCN